MVQFRSFAKNVQIAGASIVCLVQILQRFIDFIKSGPDPGTDHQCFCQGRIVFVRQIIDGFVYVMKGGRPVIVYQGNDGKVKKGISIIRMNHYFLCKKGLRILCIAAFQSLQARLVIDRSYLLTEAKAVQGTTTISATAIAHFTIKDFIRPSICCLSCRCSSGLTSNYSKRYLLLLEF